MRKSLLYSFEILMLALVFAFAFRPVRAQAASYRIVEQSPDKKDRKAGSTVFNWQNSNSALYATTNGKRAKIYSAPTGYFISNRVISNGSEVYFYVAKQNGTKCIFYHCTVAGKNLKKIATGKYYSPPLLVGYYKNSLYFVESFWGSLYSLNVKTGKIKFEGAEGMLVFGDKVCWIGKYIVYLCTTGLYSYNMATGTTTAIVGPTVDFVTTSEDDSVLDIWVPAVTAENNYVYYVRAKYKTASSGSGYYACSVIRCLADGSGKKTLVKNIKTPVDTDVTIKLTSSSITYPNLKGKKTTKKF